MAGAGGGGFIFVLTKEPNMVDKVKTVIKEMQVTFGLNSYLPLSRGNIKCVTNFTYVANTAYFSR